jgi:hypothetical protein
MPERNEQLARESDDHGLASEWYQARTADGRVATGEIPQGVSLRLAGLRNKPLEPDTTTSLASPTTRGDGAPLWNMLITTSCSGLVTHRM